MMDDMMKILDGRRDAEEFDRSDPTLTLDEASVEFEPPTERFKTTQKSPEVTRLKTAIIDIMFFIDDLKCNFR